MAHQLLATRRCRSAGLTVKLFATRDAIGLLEQEDPTGVAALKAKAFNTFEKARVVAVARVAERVVGIFGLAGSLRSAQTCGTWVHHSYRKRGIASRLWEEALRYRRPLRVQCYTISKAGSMLAASVARSPWRDFRLDHDTDYDTRTYQRPAKTAHP